MISVLCEDRMIIFWHFRAIINMHNCRSNDGFEFVTHVAIPHTDIREEISEICTLSSPTEDARQKSFATYPQYLLLGISYL